MEEALELGAGDGVDASLASGYITQDTSTYVELTDEGLMLEGMTGINSVMNSKVGKLRAP